MTTPAEVQALTAAALAAAKAAHDAALALSGIPPTQPPEPPASARFAYYPGAQVTDWVARVAAFEKETGIDVVQVSGNQDQRYEGARGSVAGVFGSKVPVDTISCAIQLAFTGGPYGDTVGKGPGAVKRKALAATIVGENDEIYRANVKVMQASPYGQIILRLGSEGDIPYPPHSFAPGTESGARANDDLYREAWAHVRAIFADALGSRVRFSYTCTMFAAENKVVCHDGKTRTALEAGCPDLFNLVGIDCYLSKSLANVQRLAGAGIAFAREHGKPAAFDEWGITPDGHGLPAAEQCAFMQWIAACPVEYASFFGGWAQSRWPDDYSAAAWTCLADAWK